MKTILLFSITLLLINVRVYAQKFDPRQENPFSLTDNNHSNSTVAFADLHGDGVLDMMSGSSTGDFEYYENIGTKTSPLFASRQENPFSLTNNNHSNSTVAFVDLDGDGDLDMMSGSSTGDFEYYENIGTKTSPLFAARQENPFSLTNNNHSNSTVVFVDLDGDGDLDMMSGSSTGDFEYYELKFRG